MKTKFRLRSVVVSLIVSVAVLLGLPTFANGQTDAEIKDAMVKGLTLMDQGRYAEAVPHLELLVKALPDQPNLRLMYGVALVTRSKQTTDLAEAKKASAEALVQLQTAKKLGVNDPQLDSLIKLLGGEPGPVATDNASPKLSEAEKVLEQAEIQFTKSNYDEAIVLYDKALSLDPKLYEAALHAGDAHVAKQDWEKAEKSYQKAISIDPERETAYRYSATPFMKQKKYDQARDRYVEAYVAEPYNRMSHRGINQWAEVTNASLRHPDIAFPKEGEKAAAEAKSAIAWNAYVATRADWKQSKFAKTNPSEKAYRHSLKEETEAIRVALKIATENKIEDKDLKLLQKLDAEGLLEAYVLIARPDDGIAGDHRAYWRENRANLRKYVLNYMITK